MKKLKSQIHLSDEVRNQKPNPGEESFYFPAIVFDYNGNTICVRLSHRQISTILNNCRVNEDDLFSDKYCRMYGNRKGYKKMKILVDRFTSDSDTTISRVFVDGHYFCFGLEDEYRLKKVWSETRIPAGTYKIGVRDVGGFHDKYKKRFADIHNGMLHIMDVPDFEHILIHCGNKDDDTAGCLLVGDGAITTPGDMMITNSTDAYRRFYSQVIDAAKSGMLEITFIDNDGD